MTKKQQLFFGQQLQQRHSEHAATLEPKMTCEKNDVEDSGASSYCVFGRFVAAASSNGVRVASSPSKFLPAKFGGGRQAGRQFWRCDGKTAKPGERAYVRTA